MPKPAPHELELIRDIYLAVLDEPWFNSNAVTERELLKVVYRICVGADEAPEVLAGLCRNEARERFSRMD